MPDNHSALRGSIKVPFFRKLYNLLYRGKIKTSQSRSMLEIVGPVQHQHSLISYHLGDSDFVLLPLDPTDHESAALTPPSTAS